MLQNRYIFSAAAYVISLPAFIYIFSHEEPTWFWFPMGMVLQALLAWPLLMDRSYKSLSISFGVNSLIILGALILGRFFECQLGKECGSVFFFMLGWGGVTALFISVLMGGTLSFLFIVRKFFPQENFYSGIIFGVVVSVCWLVLKSLS